jgi:hypothetical protein
LQLAYDQLKPEKRYTSAQKFNGASNIRIREEIYGALLFYLKQMLPQPLNHCKS